MTVAFTVVWFCATVTVGGAVKTAVLLLDRLTTWPPGPAGRDNETTTGADSKLRRLTVSGRPIAWEIATQFENSEVLFEPSVAVAVTNWPGAAVKSGIVALPFASVVTAVAPRNVAPSPLPETSQAVLPKNSMRNVPSGVLFSEPVTPPAAAVRTGKF